MADPAGAASPEALASALLTAHFSVMLTGIRLGESDPLETGDPRGEWARNASLEVLLTDPARFWRFFYPRALAAAERHPNAAHTAIARLQRAGILSAVVTQAVDRLHLKAGSPEVVEVYGHLLLAKCERCGERYGLPEVGMLMERSVDGVPRCTTEGCSFPLRPEGTLWGEPLPVEAVTRAWELAAAADLFVVVDSPLRTAPISLLPSVPLTRRVPLVIIGQVPTQYDRYAALVVRTPSIEVLAALADLVAPSPAP